MSWADGEQSTARSFLTFPVDPGKFGPARSPGGRMVNVKGARQAFLAQQRGQIQLLIIAPILTLSFLGLLVRSASSAVDHRVEKKKIVAELKRRLDEVNIDLLQERQESQTDSAGDSSGEALEHGWIAVGDGGGETTILPFVSVEHSLSFDSSSLFDERELDERELDESGLDETAPSPQDLRLSHTFPFKTSYRVRKGDTLEAILQSEGVAPEQIPVWIAAAKQHKTLWRLQRGRHFSFVFVEGDKTPKTPLLKSLTYELDPLSRLILEYEEGKITTRKETLPTTLVWRVVGGQITRSLYTAALKAGVPLRIVDEMADMDWDLNFSSDLKSGDTFKVIFEEIQQDGAPVKYGGVLAAEIVNNGKTSTLFSLPRGKGQSPSESGVAASSAKTHSGQRFLRYPVRFTRISSVFTKARFHPILKRKRPHNGVDFAAPRGTPVRAVADGKITTAGWVGGFGRLIRIDHPGPYMTEYAHLNRIAKGIKTGNSVKRGQVIGTVGSTGLATGPHLHFGLFRNGRYINPLSKDLPRTQQIVQRKATPDPFIAEMKKTLTAYLGTIEASSVPATQVLAALTKQTRESAKPHS